MNQAYLGNNSDASPVLPVKRKRGRPRKDQSLNRVGAARVPPGFRVMNGNPAPQVDPINDANVNMVGQTVSGVVEAAFDAGFLLAVKIGNSNITLRGVVFKPGHFAPVTAENDVAPHVQMIRRNETNFSTESQTRVRGRKPRKERNNLQLVNYLGNGSPPANQVLKLAPPSRGKYVPAPSVPPVGARGTVVPVVLQPVNLSNGLPANQAAHLTALKGKHMQTVLPLAVCPPNGSSSQALPLQPQTSPHVTPTGSRNDDGPFSQSTTEVRQREEPKPIKSSDVHLQAEVNKGFQGSSQSSETQNGNSKPEREIADMNEPLFIEPLQTRHVSKPVENNGTGSMSVLLQAVEHQATGFMVAFHDPKNAETHTRGKETVQAQSHSQAGSM